MSKRQATNGPEDCEGPVGKKRHIEDSNTLAINFPWIVTPWASAEIPTSLPPLPKILDPKLEQAVFTHPGVSANNYVRLEWLGDARLEQIATDLIFETFTDSTPGRCSQLREMLIRNTTLAGYFRDYGMESKAALPESLTKDRHLGRGRSADKDRLKTQGDMFEAYVAAVIKSDAENGLANATEWLKALFGRTIKDHIVANEKKNLHASSENDGPKPEAESNSSAKEQLRVAIGAKGVNLRYVDLPSNKKDKDLKLPLYVIGLYLDGWGETNKMLGVGTALSKKEAGQKAAQRALENRKLMKEYESKKKAFNEAMRAAEEADGP